MRYQVLDLVGVTLGPYYVSLEGRSAPLLLGFVDIDFVGDPATHGVDSVDSRDVRYILAVVLISGTTNKLTLSH